MSQFIRIPYTKFLIEKKTDFLAASAFLLAAVSALFQISQFLRGADLSIVPPDQVMIIFDDGRYNPNSQRYMRIAARMAYVNTGTEGFNSTIRRESVSFTIGDSRYVQYSQSVSAFWDPENDGILNTEHISGAGPRSINAGGSLSREIYFTPYPVRCPEEQEDCDPFVQYLLFSDIIQILWNKPEITFTFTSSLIGESPISTFCTVELTRLVREQLVRQGWSAPVCWRSRRMAKQEQGAAVERVARWRQQREPTAMAAQATVSSRPDSPSATRPTQRAASPH